MKHFTSTARRDGRWWVVQCDQYPAALSQVARLDQAVDHQREAIAFVAELDEDDVDVEVRPVLELDAIAELEAVRQERDRAEELAREATRRFATLLEELLGQGLSMRDAGWIAGVSHQRVAQLVGHRD